MAAEQPQEAAIPTDADAPADVPADVPTPEPARSSTPTAAQPSLPPNSGLDPSSHVDTSARSPAPSRSNTTESFASVTSTFASRTDLWNPRTFEDSPLRSLRLSFTGNKKHVLTSKVLDIDTEAEYYTLSGDSDATEMHDRDGKVVARMEWHTFAASKLDYKLHQYEIKNWIPISKKKRRTVTHNGRDYEWIVIDGVQVLQIVGMPGHNVAIWDNHRGIISIEILPEGLLLDIIEPVVLSVVLLECGHSIGQGDASGTITGGRESKKKFVDGVESGVGEGIGTDLVNYVLGTDS